MVEKEGGGVVELKPEHDYVLSEVAKRWGTTKSEALARILNMVVDKAMKESGSETEPILELLGSGEGTSSFVKDLAFLKVLSSDSGSVAKALQPMMYFLLMMGLIRSLQRPDPYELILLEKIKGSSEDAIKKYFEELHKRQEDFWKKLEEIIVKTKEKEELGKLIKTLARKVKSKDELKEVINSIKEILEKREKNELEAKIKELEAKILESKKLEEREALLREIEELKKRIEEKEEKKKEEALLNELKNLRETIENKRKIEEIEALKSTLKEMSDRISNAISSLQYQLSYLQSQPNTQDQITQITDTINKLTQLKEVIDRWVSMFAPKKVEVTPPPVTKEGKFDVQQAIYNLIKDISDKILEIYKLAKTPPPAYQPPAPYYPQQPVQSPFFQSLEQIARVEEPKEEEKPAITEQPKVEEKKEEVKAEQPVEQKAEEVKEQPVEQKVEQPQITEQPQETVEVQPTQETSQPAPEQQPAQTPEGTQPQEEPVEYMMWTGEGEPTIEVVKKDIEELKKQRPIDKPIMIIDQTGMPLYYYDPATDELYPMK